MHIKIVINNRQKVRKMS